MNLPKCKQGCEPALGYTTTVIQHTTQERSASGEVMSESAQYWCLKCGWRSNGQTYKYLDENFLFRQIRKYNQAVRQTNKDVILRAIGIHAGFFKPTRSFLPTLSDEQRKLVLYFIRLFLASHSLDVKVKE
jgi:hypothetical protein